MKKTKITMGMPAVVEILDEEAEEKSLDQVFDYFSSVDERFSTYKPTSEISLWNLRQQTS
jgi:thiamine biosynthesis lipoprotein ApbE